MNKSTVVWALILAIFVALVAWLIVTPGKPGKLDAFASCLADSGVKFYGAFWCPHCQDQKAMFGSSTKKLPYIECSNPDQKQNDYCNSLGIPGYPTWVFPVGLAGSTTTSTSTQLYTLEALAAKSSCVLPE